jgi:hypothetical protein
MPLWKALLALADAVEKVFLADDQQLQEDSGFDHFRERNFRTVKLNSAPFRWSQFPVLMA